MLLDGWRSDSPVVATTSRSHGPAPVAVLGRAQQQHDVPRDIDYARRGRAPVRC
ncbi:hypothetical protein RR21198_1567, partial [Rhodococcus rhodochrous ATCC 21198]